MPVIWYYCIDCDLEFSVIERGYRDTPVCCPRCGAVHDKNDQHQRSVC